MRIELMITATQSAADTTSVSTTIELDTQRPGWEQTLVQAVTDQAYAGAERLREHLVTHEGPTPTRESTHAYRFTPLASIVPSATAGRAGV
jgi:hypothetical protein